MEKIIFRSFLMIAFCFIFSSCNKNEVDDNNAIGTITFNYNSILSSSTKALVQNIKSDSSIEVIPSAIIISVIDNLGNKVVNTEKIALYNMNGHFISKPLALKQGNYKLSDFLVIDKDGNVIYLTPKEGSPKAYLVSDPLPVEFIVNKDQVTNVTVEVLKNTGETPGEYGYSTFTFNIVDLFNFYVSVFTYADTTQNFKLTSSNIEIQKDNKIILESLLLPIANSIPLRKDMGNYTVSIKKNGYRTYSINLTLYDLLNYTTSKPLVVVLTKSEFNITNGLIAYYPFNGNANDESGNALNGTVFGATSTTDRNNRPNGAYKLNGIDQHIDFPNDSQLKPKFPFTLSFWFKLDQYDNSNQLLTTDFALDIYTGAFIAVNINGYVGIGFGNGEYISINSRFSRVGNTKLNLNQWYHIVGEYISPTQLEIFINGVNDSGYYTGYASKLVYSNNAGSIGRKDAGNSTQPPYYFKGYIDDVAFYNRVLTQSEVTALYNYR